MLLVELIHRSDVTVVDNDVSFLNNLVSDMARVYNWDVKRRQSEKTSTS